MNNLELYAIQSKDGKWFRRKGYGGSGECWTEDFKKARIYVNKGPCRGVISWWNNNYPQYGTPYLVILKIDEIKKIDESDLIKQKEQKKLEKEKISKIKETKYQIDLAEKTIQDAKLKLEKLKKGL